MKPLPDDRPGMQGRDAEPGSSQQPPPPRPSQRVHHLAAWQRWGLYGCSAGLLLSGLAWLALNYTVGPGADGLPHPAQAWLLRSHGLLVQAALFLFGVVAAVHLPPAWRASAQRRWAHQRGSGLLLGAAAALLAASGYALYYFAPEGLRPGLGLGHSAAGLALVAGLLWHRRGARATRRSAGPQQRPT